MGGGRLLPPRLYAQRVEAFLYLTIVMDLHLLELSDQEIARRNSLDEIRQMGINPYPPRLVYRYW